MKTMKTVWVNVYQNENMIDCGGTWPSLDDAERNFDVSGGRKYLGAQPVCVEIDEPEPKKPRLLAPAMYHTDEQWVLGRTLFGSKKEAREYHGDRKVIWPAVANKDGYFEVPE